MTSLRLRDYLMKGNYADIPAPATLAPSPGTSVYYWAFDTRLMYLLNEDNTAWLAQNTVPEAPIDSQMYMRKDGDWELYVPYTDENVRDVMGAALTAGTGVTVTVDDPGDTITLAIDTAAEAERIRDVMGAALVAGLGLTATVDDPGNTITLDIDTTAEAERVRDVMGAALTAGTNISITVNDAGDTITIDATGITSYSAENARDDVGAALTAGTGLTKTIDDPGDTITLAIDTTAEAERIRDVMGTALVAGSNITLTVNDAGDTITIDSTGGGGSSGSTAMISARYWRVRRVTEVSGHTADGLGFGELKFLNNVGTNLVGSGTPIYSAQDTAGGWPASEAFDSTAGGAGNGWYAGANAYGGWLGYDFGSAVTPYQISFTPLTSNLWSIGAQVAVDYSTDGTYWTYHSSFMCGTGVDSTYQTYSLAAKSTGYLTHVQGYPVATASDILGTKGFAFRGGNAAIPGLVDTPNGTTVFGGANGSAWLQKAFGSYTRIRVLTTLGQVGFYDATTKAVIQFNVGNGRWITGNITTTAYSADDATYSSVYGYSRTDNPTWMSARISGTSMIFGLSHDNGQSWEEWRNAGSAYMTATGFNLAYAGTIHALLLD